MLFSYEVNSYSITACEYSFIHCRAYKAMAFLMYTNYSMFIVQSDMIC